MFILFLLVTFGVYELRSAFNVYLVQVFSFLCDVLTTASILKLIITIHDLVPQTLREKIID